MKPGDLILIDSRSHYYLDNWKMGEPPTRVEEKTLAVYIGYTQEDGPRGRMFYDIITDRGRGKINAMYCTMID